MEKMNSEEGTNLSIVEKYEEEHSLSGLSALYEYAIENDEGDVLAQMMTNINDGVVETFKNVLWSSARMKALAENHGQTAAKNARREKLVLRIEMISGKPRSTWKPTYIRDEEKKLSIHEKCINFGCAVMAGSYVNANQRYLVSALRSSGLHILAEEAHEYVH